VFAACGVANQALLISNQWKSLDPRRRKRRNAIGANESAGRM
jgi:hypothetical protein